jgi:hypothetical protein
VETWQVYGMDGELLAEYASGAAPFLATTEYGYRKGELLVTLTSGDDQRLRRFVQDDGKTSGAELQLQRQLLI